MIQKFIQYLKDVRSELIKVSWPSRNELTGATLLVVGLSIAVSLFVYGCDMVLKLVLDLFYRIGV